MKLLVKQYFSFCWIEKKIPLKFLNYDLIQEFIDPTFRVIYKNLQNNILQKRFSFYNYEPRLLGAALQCCQATARRNSMRMLHPVIFNRICKEIIHIVSNMVRSWDHTWHLMLSMFNFLEFAGLGKWFLTIPGWL